MSAQTASPPEELATVPPEVWAKGKTDVGLLTTATPVTITLKPGYLPRIKQYPLKPDAEEGIAPVIANMLKAGILVESPDCPTNTPIFPVKKADSGSWRLVHDLRAVNSAEHRMFPTHTHCSIN